LFYQSQHIRRRPCEPLTGPERVTLRRVFPFKKIPRRFFHAQELLGIAGLGFGIGRQILSTLFLHPASGRREAVVRKVVSLSHRRHPTGPMQGLLHKWRGLFAEAPLKLFAPDLRRRIWVISQATEDLEEMPVPLELPVVITVLRPEQIERLHLMRM